MNTLPGLIKKVFKLLVAAGCLYELGALPERTNWHTVSHLCNTAIRAVNWRHRLMAWAFIGALTFHLIGLERPVWKWLTDAADSTQRLNPKRKVAHA